MAFPTKDGQKKFGSAFKTKRYDEFHAPSAEHEKSESPVFEAAEKEGQDEQQQNEGHENPQEVVAEHGPAHSVHIHHDHENKKHKVVSHHADGHMHESEHGTPDEAHEHGKQLSKSDMEEAQSAEQGARSEENGFEQPETA